VIQQTLFGTRPETPALVGDCDRNHGASEKSAAGRGVKSVASVVVAPAGRCEPLYPIRGDIEPEAGFLQRRLRAFVRARAQWGARAPCWFCGHTVWWRSVVVPDVVRCGFCSPPAAGVEVEWLGEVEAISGEMPGGSHVASERPGL